MNFSIARLSFLNHFPSLTVTPYDFLLKGSAPFKNDALLACNESAFGIDVSSLYKSRTNINKIILTNERFELKAAGFRSRFEGQVSLDGKLNLTGRLGRPPFGIIGIPFTVMGTQEDHKCMLGETGKPTT